ncbi:MAG: family 20 glycosylhydrolase [Phycisphaerae bacterium]|nr:family 20 glycosylhydrolase [Phycisphaerae bacterium]
MIAFHIDMNIAQFTRPYLEKWLRDLSRLGYDTIIWEVENNIAWETCPECVSPDAFSKEEFNSLLALSRELGLEPIPLLQTIGHCEYVLKHDKYQYLAENDGKIDQYCPRKPELMPFLHKWVEEYLELFGDVRYFHIGADEAWSLGSCPACQAYAKEHSLSHLFIDHVNEVCEPLIAKNITPIIWADMVLHHNEALHLLSRNIMLFDWMYDIYHGNGKVYVWGGKQRLCSKDELPPETLERFGKHLFPHGDEPGREPKTFYTADFLAAEGFRVVTCPSSSSYRDNVFSPRNYYHMANTFDSTHKGIQPHLNGAVLTSWTVHLFPWELQLACIDMPGFIADRPTEPIEKYQRKFLKDRFGVEKDEAFWEACGLLSKSCLFTHTQSLSFTKEAFSVPLDHAEKEIAKILEGGQLEDELSNCEARLAEYRQALSLFDVFAGKASKGQDILDWWLLAGRNLVNRAEASIFLLQKAKVQTPDNGHGQKILEDMQALRDETEAAYAPIIKPSRRKEIIAWLYASVEHALVIVVG